MRVCVKEGGERREWNTSRKDARASIPTYVWMKCTVQSARSSTHMPLTKPCLWQWWNPSPSLRFLSVATLSPPLKSVEEVRGRKLQLSSQFTSVSCLRPPFCSPPKPPAAYYATSNSGSQKRKGNNICSVWLFPLECGCKQKKRQNWKAPSFRAKQMPSDKFWLTPAHLWSL